MSAATTLVVALDLSSANPARSAQCFAADSNTQKTEFSTLASAVLQGMRHRGRNLRIVRLLLEGQSVRWIHRSTGLPRGTIRKIRGRMVLAGVKCACGRALNHVGQCGERLKNYPAARCRRAMFDGRCRKGHPYTRENRYVYRDRDTCRICSLECRRQRVARRTGRQPKPRILAAALPARLPVSSRLSLLAGYRQTSQHRHIYRGALCDKEDLYRGAARIEARSLLECLGRGTETVESLRDLIRLSEKEERNLLAFMQKANGDGEPVRKALIFRQLVLEEFENLAEQPRYAERIAQAQAAAINRAATKVPVGRPPGELAVTFYADT